MIDPKALLTDLQTLLKRLEADLLDRSESDEVPDVGRTLHAEYERAKQAERTVANYEDWRSDTITQAAAAWVLSCVFVRFLEDNLLIEPPRIAGPKERLQMARDEHEIYFRAHPRETDRDYLLVVFDELAKLPGSKDVFGEHNPVRELPKWLSGDAAGEMVQFFQKINADTGELFHDFTDQQWDTRFLGDLYQDLSEAARKKFALLQTPEFVEEFILDRTLEPAIDEFGLDSSPLSLLSEQSMVGKGRDAMDNCQLPTDVFKMIDPACGSGHFLLSSFRRILEHRRRKQPNAKVRDLVQRTLDSIHGVDVNPYAVAIARFRLLLMAIQAEGIKRLTDAPGYRIHLAVGDSLMHGLPSGDQLSMGWRDVDHVYHAEDRAALQRLLAPGRYHTVVANPPYITPKDPALNDEYRRRYPNVCHMKYSLAVPFMQRLFELACSGGFTGQITANSFMKREFGKKLIENFLPRVDLTHVIDTQCVHLPAYGTSTVILLGRQQPPVRTDIRLVSTLKNEEPKPRNPELGKVWLAVLAQVDAPGSQTDFATVNDTPREYLTKHPWSIGGGGAAELKKRLDSVSEVKLGSVSDSVGYSAIVGDDEAFVADNAAVWLRKCITEGVKPFAVGNSLRDWTVTDLPIALYPYDGLGRFVENCSAERHFWPLRSILRTGLFYGKTKEARGLDWRQYAIVVKDKLRSSKALLFAFVATHNHVVFDRTGYVSNKSAPGVKLPPDATDDDHLVLLGLLNSSVSCFWMKQMFQDKGGGGIGGGISAEAWERRFEHDGTKLKQFPIPVIQPLALSRDLDQLAGSLSSFSPDALLRTTPSEVNRQVLVERRVQWETIRRRLIALQEELDWQCYRSFALIDIELTYVGKPPVIALGQRAFEIVMARRMRAGELQTSWFDRHGGEPITDIPTEWPDDYKKLVERRIELIETDRNISLIEQPEYKRRWNTEPWESQLKQALRQWLLDRLESYFDFDGRMNDEVRPTARVDISLTTVAKLADVANQDATFMEVGELYRDDPAFDVQRLVAELVQSESVPLLPVLRYKPSGLRKRAEWEKTWDLQRREDAIDARTSLPHNDPQYLTEDQSRDLKRHEIGDIPVPPKYTSADFLSSGGARYWALRGKLDVPKERWISFPHCEGPDGTLVIAWAGYDHLQLARAISAYYVEIQEHLGGRDDPRLVPLLACVIELLPWLRQWHHDIDPDFDQRMDEFFEGFVAEEAKALNMTIEEVKKWEPPKRVGGRSRQRGGT